jgi:hypothetical protein
LILHDINYFAVELSGAARDTRNFECKCQLKCKHKRNSFQRRKQNAIQTHNDATQPRTVNHSFHGNRFCPFANSHNGRARITCACWLRGIVAGRAPKRHHARVTWQASEYYQ